jgi:hypothetical protein
LRVPWRFEPLHTALPLAGGLMGVLRAVIQIPVLPMFHAWEELPRGGAITLQLVRADDPWHIGQAVEQRAEEVLRGLLVPPALHQDSEDMAVLIARPPEIVPLTTNREQDLIQVPLITASRAPATPVIGLGVPERLAPLADGFIRHDEATSEQQLFHVAVAAAEAEVQPDAMTDDRSRKPMMFVGVGGWGGGHGSSID